MFKFLRDLVNKVKVVTKPIMKTVQPISKFSNKIFKAVGISKLFKLNRKIVKPFNEPLFSVYDDKEIKIIRKKDVERIYNKAIAISQTLSLVGDILRGKSNVVVSLESTVQDSLNKNNLMVMEDDELFLTEGILDSILESYNIKVNQYGKIEVRNQEFFESSVKVSYELYMEQWYNKFWDSDTTDDMSYDEKFEIWQQIAESRTYDWFVQNKL